MIRTETIPVSSSITWLGRLEIVENDITRITADAIVNAASHSLLGNAGLSAALFAAAGPELRDECAALGGCASGEAKITKAYRLSARHVIHAVGPIWYGGVDREDEVLARCYESCFKLVERYGHRTIAFPSIGTGAHGFPLERAASIALAAITGFLVRNAAVEKITVVCYDRETYRGYLRTLQDLISAANT
ncbi:MAG TPA: macro domain-containing protein [Pirellulales bacterium]|nr:macro domain-containing protein [Pirellulales bacterium]